jgi:hypothetical protein
MEKIVTRDRFADDLDCLVAGRRERQTGVFASQPGRFRTAQGNLTPGLNRCRQAYFSGVTQRRDDE